MPAIGRYAELPLPQDWEPIIWHLQPAETRPSKLFLPSPVDLLLTVFEALNGRECLILLNRYGKGQTLDQVGHSLDLTRERVRQLEKKIFAKLQIRARGFGERMNAFTRTVYETGFLIAEMPEDDRPGMPDATLDEMWRCALTTYAKAYTKPYMTEKVSEGRWIIYNDFCVRPDLLKNVFKGKPRFVPTHELAAHVGTDPQSFVQALTFFDGVFLTRSGLVGSSCWTILQFIEAVAWELQAEGFADWHFSEMARALEAIYPKRFMGIVSRNIAAALSRDEAKMFQHVGQKGKWQLGALGDGNRGNREAIIQVFMQNPRLMHYTDVVKHLNRRVHPETVHALLYRDEAFRGYGDGVYGLAQGHSHSPVIDDKSMDGPPAGDFELTDFLLDILGDTKALITPIEPAVSSTPEPSCEIDKLSKPETQERSGSGVHDPSLMEDIMCVISSDPRRLTSREIAKTLGREKKVVNRCLYLHLMQAGRVAHDEDRRWYVAQRPQEVPVRVFKAPG